MKRAFIVVVALMALGGIAFSASFAVGGADAQDNRTITVDVTSGVFSDSAEGEACGFGTQLIVTDASGDIVGTVDLVDITTAYTAPGPTYHGTISGNLCVVSGSIDVTDSAYYTFTIRDMYEWTISAADLESNDWTMTVALPR